MIIISWIFICIINRCYHHTTHTRVETTCHINFPPKKSKVATSYLHVRKNKVDYSKMRNDSLCRKDIQCPPLNRITLGQRKSDNNNRMIQLTNVFWVLLRYNGTSIIWFQCAAESIICDLIKRRALYINGKWKCSWKISSSERE